MESEGQTSYVAATAPKPTTITSNSFTTPKFKKSVEIKGAESWSVHYVYVPNGEICIFEGVKGRLGNNNTKDTKKKSLLRFDVVIDRISYCQCLENPFFCV